MDEETRAHIGALTGAIMELANILGQRHVIDAGDIHTLHDIMHQALRPRQGEPDRHEKSREWLAKWTVRATSLAPDSLPLPSDGRS